MDTFLYAQLQPFSLYGAGATSGDTTLQLTSFQSIDGVNLAMTDFGSIAFGTIEPNNASQEEQISFTGITQNSDGTATLTGVKTVLFLSPYTQTSGLAKSHPGGVTFVISNTSGFYDKLTSKSDDETITGLWQFPNDASTPILGTSYVAPTLEYQIASKGYADSLAIAGAPNASTTQKGIVQLPTQSGVDNKTASGGTGASFAVTPDKLRATKYNDYVVATGTAQAMAIAPAPLVTQYVAGLEFRFRAIHSNESGTVTLNVNGIGAKSIKVAKGDPSAQFIRTNTIVGVVYDGTNFQLTEVSRPLLSQEGAEIYGTSTTSNTVYTVALAPALTSYRPGLTVRFMPDTAASGGATVNVNGLGAKTIIKASGQTGLTANDIPANSVAQITYDGTNFQLQNPGSGNFKLAAVTTGQSISSNVTEVNLVSMYIPALILGTNNAIRVRVSVSDFGIGASTNATFRLRYHGTAVATTLLSNASAATTLQASEGGIIEALLVGAGTTSSQEGSLYCSFGSGTMAAAGAVTHTISGNGVPATGAVNSTLRRTLTLSVQFATSSGSDKIATDHSIVEVIR